MLKSGIQGFHKLSKIAGLYWTLIISGICSAFLITYCKSTEFPVADTIHPKMLTVNFLDDPIGIDTNLTYFSWKFVSKQRNQYQTAYQIIVSSDLDKLQNNDGDIWDSKKVQTDKSISVSFKGRTLISVKQYFWKVKVWDKNNKESEWSSPCTWTTGILNSQEWKARWIGIENTTHDNKTSTLHALYLRRDFNLEKPIKIAIAFFSCSDFSKLYVNGVPASEQILIPSLYKDGTAEYVALDITNLLKKGKNTLSSVVGRFGNLSNSEKNLNSSTYTGILLQVELENMDGTKIQVLSNEKWNYSLASPISFYKNDIIYDSDKEMPGWNLPGFAAENWSQAKIIDINTKLKARINTPLKVIESVQPKVVYKLKKETRIYDLGNYYNGWVKIICKVNNECNIKICYSTDTTSDGNLLESSFADRYILKPDADKILELPFIIHRFRYLAIDGLSVDPDSSAIEIQKVNFDLSVNGEFECSNNQLNILYKKASINLQNSLLQFFGLNNQYNASFDSSLCLFIPYIYNITSLLSTWENNMDSLKSNKTISYLQLYKIFYSYSNTKSNFVILSDSFQNKENLLLNKAKEAFVSNDTTIKISECEIIQLLYYFLAGIRPSFENGGFKYFLLKPVLFNGITFTKATYNSIFGPIISDWKIEKDTFRWNLCVPSNTTAIIGIPSERDKVFFMDHDVLNEIRLINYDRGYTYYEIGSGDYFLKAKLLINR
jgi:hypothetical protein